MKQEKSLPTYYTDSNGTLRRTVPKVRQSKKERIRERWAGKVRFENDKKATGRGNANVEEIEKVKEYLRKIHPETARKVQISQATGIKQDRVLIILNLLSGVSDDNKDDDAEFVPKDFLVMEDDEENELRYGIFKDTKLGIK